jgi:hypothetical protein
MGLKVFCDVRSLSVGLGKYISPVLLKLGDFRNGQVDWESFAGQAVEFVLPKALLQSWPEFARPFVHPDDAVHQGLIMFIERHECLALVWDAKGLQQS